MASRWVNSFKVILGITDFICIIITIGVSYFWKFNLDKTPYIQFDGFTVSYIEFSMGLAILWFFTFLAFSVYDEKNLGTNSDEYKNIFTATFIFFGILAIFSVLIKIQISRVFMGASLVIGVVLLLLNHLAWRYFLYSMRNKEKWMNKIVLVGFEKDLVEAINTFHRNKRLGYEIEAVFEIKTRKKMPLKQDIEGVKVAGSEDSLISWLEKTDKDIHTVAIVSYLAETSEAVQNMIWDFEEIKSKPNLIIFSQIFDLSSSRTFLQYIGEMSFVKFELPKFDGTQIMVKRIMDIFISSVALLVFSPFMLITAIAIKIEDRGPLIFSQEREGLNGESFNIYKFRSMKLNAPDSFDAARQIDKETGEVFKTKDDPRITKVGKFIRKYSIDEIPQLFNVFKGDMSIVGPRPLVPDEIKNTNEIAEVDLDYAHFRRLKVKPGITGLWQVSGRSDVSWEQRINLDLTYVENWSIFNDIFIMLKTVKVMLKGENSY
ncbi:MAG: sugar transferase [Micrococcaceae bacterium]